MRVCARIDALDTIAELVSFAPPCSTFRIAIASTKAPPGTGSYHQRSYFTTGSAAVISAPTSVIIHDRYIHSRNSGSAASAP